MLAATHLLTLGFMAMVMMGAMMQMLPVVAGSPVRNPRLIAWLVHPPLTVGALLLSAGFFSGQPSLIKLAIPVLASAFVVFLAAIGFSLALAPAHNATINAMRLAIVSLAVTVVLGVVLAAAVSGYAGIPLLQFTALHAAWGLLGWVGLLVIGVAYQVVPMFQLTPVYPRSVTRWLAWVVFGLAVFLSGSMLLLEETAWAATAIFGGLAGSFAVFAVATLYLQLKRRRRIPDVTLRFWRVGMTSLLASVVLWTVAQFSALLQSSATYPVLLGMLFIHGFAVSVISGMLYKIVPFLVWFHLHGKRDDGVAVPNMKEIIPDRAAQRQLLVHTASLLLLLLSGTTHATMLFYAAFFTMGISAAMLWLNFFAASRLYRLCAGKMA